MLNSPQLAAGKLSIFHCKYKDTAAATSPPSPSVRHLCRGQRCSAVEHGRRVQEDLATSRRYRQVRGGDPRLIRHSKGNTSAAQHCFLNIKASLRHAKAQVCQPQAKGACSLAAAQGH